MPICHPAPVDAPREELEETQPSRQETEEFWTEGESAFRADAFWPELYLRYNMDGQKGDQVYRRANGTYHSDRVEYEAVMAAAEGSTALLRMAAEAAKDAAKALDLSNPVWLPEDEKQGATPPDDSHGSLYEGPSASDEPVFDLFDGFPDDDDEIEALRANAERATSRAGKTLFVPKGGAR